MKIGIDASRAFKKNKTGVEWYAHHVIKNILKIDSENQFVLYYLPHRSVAKAGDKKILDSSVRWNDKGRENFKIKYLRWPFKFLWTQGRLSLEMFFKAPDILFVPASAMPIIHPKNTVVTIHDVGFMQFFANYSFLQRIYLKWSTKFAIKYAKKIITISEFSKKEIIKYFKADADKIFVTHLGYDEKVFNQERDDSLNRKILDKYKIIKPYILYVGRLEKKKNILNIVKAFNEFNQDNKYQLVLAGMKGYGFEEVKELINNNIILTNYVLDKDLPVLYKNAKLFLFPTLYEGFGLPIVEAMACGVPVVTSNTTSLPEVAGDSAILVNPENYKEIADEIEKILNNNELQQQIIKKGSERVKNFSWEKTAKETLKILN